MNTNRWKPIVSWALSLLLTFLVIYVVRTKVLLIAHIPTDSMATTLNVGDEVICFNTYFYNGLKRGDIVVFKPNTGEKELWVKRIIGVPGDKIQIDNGIVYVNGEKLEEDYTSSLVKYTGSFAVPEDKYFLLGDNRAVSQDARFWINPFIDESDILYKDAIKIYPFNEIKLL